MSESSVQSGQGDDGGNSNSGNGGQNAPVRKPNVRRSNFALVGTVVISILVIGLALGIAKPEWQQYFKFGFTTREINFSGNYFVLNNAAKVKLGGVEVGRIDNVTQREDGTATYKVRVLPDVIDKVGSAPSANLRPVSLLGGIEYVDLQPGGDRTQPWNDAIPLERTHLPVELGAVLQSIQPDAVAGIPAGINGLQGALDNGGGPALKRLAREAPPALEPGGRVLNALTGNNPGSDLPNVVSGLQKTSAVLARKDGQIESVLRDLRTTSSAFAQSSANTSLAIRKLPVTLDTARAGLARLSITLDKLEETAPEARPTVRELDRLLQRLDPVLVKARPVVNDLRYALEETRPLVEDLVPAAKDLRYTFKNLDPSLVRLAGPVTDALESGYDPTDDTAQTGANGNTFYTAGPLGDPVVSSTEYTADTGRRHAGISASDNPKPTLREEAAQFIRRANGAVGYYDRFGGSATAFSAGIGTDSAPGLEQLAQQLVQGLLGSGAQIPGLPISTLAAGPLKLPALPAVQGLPAALPGVLPKLGAPAAVPARPAAPQSQVIPRSPVVAPAAPALPGGLLTGGAR